MLYNYDEICPGLAKPEGATITGLVGLAHHTDL